MSKVYPDVLGTITNGQRLTLDPLQIAAAIHPDAISAGKSFEVIIVLQNTVEADVDAVVRPILPEKDLGGQAGRFTTKIVKPIRIGLRPGEVGYASLPTLVAHQTTPGKGYTVQIEIQVETKQRELVRVRNENGGTTYRPTKPNAHVDALRQLTYSVEAMLAKAAGVRLGGSSASKALLSVHFEVLPAAISALPTELKPEYVTLWSAADYVETPPELAVAFTDDVFKDETAVALSDSNRTQPANLNGVLSQLTPDQVFFPLLKLTQTYFEHAHYRLWAGEAVMVAKLLARVLENHDTGRWIDTLTHMLAQQPEIAISPDVESVLDRVYPDLIHDAAIQGFQTLTQSTGEDFGTHDEMVEYADGLVALLTGSGDPLDIIHAYLPLALAGLEANAHIVMSGEKPAQTVDLFASATQKRAAEENDNNQFIFEMARKLIGRT